MSEYIAARDPTRFIRVYQTSPGYVLIPVIKIHIRYRGKIYLTVHLKEFFIINNRRNHILVMKDLERSNLKTVVYDPD
jgi:hypothetical protein